MYFFCGVRKVISFHHSVNCPKKKSSKNTKENFLFSFRIVQESFLNVIMKNQVLIYLVEIYIYFLKTSIFSILNVMPIHSYQFPLSFGFCPCFIRTIDKFSLFSSTWCSLKYFCVVSAGNTLRKKVL